RRLTGYGCNDGPPPLHGIVLADEDRLTVDVDNPVVWQVRGETMFCACNGWVEELPAHPNVVRFVGDLAAARDRTWRVLDLLNDLEGSVTRGDIEFVAERDEIRSLLEMFCSLRALRKIGADPA